MQTNEEPQLTAPVQRIVSLVVHVEHLNGEFTVERQAPLLPDGVTWHAGMELDDMEVDAVRVFLDGTVEVWFREQYQSDVSEMSLRDFTGTGWNVRHPIRIWSN